MFRRSNVRKHSSDVNDPLRNYEKYLSYFLYSISGNINQGTLLIDIYNLSLHHER